VQVAVGHGLCRHGRARCEDGAAGRGGARPRRRLGRGRGQDVDAGQRLAAGSVVLHQQPQHGGQQLVLPDPVATPNTNQTKLPLLLSLIARLSIHVYIYRIKDPFPLKQKRIKDHFVFGWFIHCNVQLVLA